MTRYLTVFVVLSCFLFSCSEEDSEVVSKWKLIEQLADPGDGSGTFQPVESDKTVTFYEDETFISNGTLCTMTVNVGNGSTGSYSLQDSTITVDGCGFSTPYAMTFEVQGSFMILNYPCIEPCREKYAMVQ